VWKEVLFNIVFIACIGLGNMLLAHWAWKTPLTLHTFLIWQGLTFAVGIFPTLIGALVGQMRLSKKYMAEAAQLSRQVHPSQAAHPQTVTLVGDNQNDTLRLDAGQIAWLSAADNYVQVFYFENEVLKSRMLRSTLKKMEEALSDAPQFFRCHRTYVVNLEKVTGVSGNAQGYRQHIAGAETTVPVSRNFNDIIRQRLAST
jgi:DNA-binding LytR/AlgR family response regulator